MAHLANSETHLQDIITTNPPIDYSTQVASSLQTQEKSAQFDTFLTRIPAGVYRYELMPFFKHPKDLLVLNCLNRHHSQNFIKRSQLIINHFDELKLEEKIRRDSEILLKEQLEAVLQYTKRDFCELKSICGPPPLLVQFTSMSVIILTGNLKPSWPAWQKLVNPNGGQQYTHTMIHLDKDDISEEAIHACRKILTYDKSYSHTRDLSWSQWYEYLEEKQRSVSSWPVGVAIGRWCYTLVFRYHVSEEELEIRKELPVESFERVFDQLRKISSNVASETV